MRINDFNAVNEDSVLSVKIEHFANCEDDCEDCGLKERVLVITYLNKDLDTDVIFNLSDSEIKEFLVNMNAFWAQRNS